jgi:nicotinamidase-related amidase
MTQPDLASVPGLADQVVRRGILSRIAALAAAARRYGIPVIHCTIAPRGDFSGTAASSPLMASIRRGRLRQGNIEAEIDEAVAPDPADHIVPRLSGVTSFYGTALDTVLRGLETQTVILTGVSTNVALPGTTIEATNRGYNVVVPEDCTAGGSPETHQFMIREFFPLLSAVTTAEAVLAALQASGHRGVIA